MKLAQNKSTIALLSIAFLYLVLLLTGVIKNLINLSIFTTTDKAIGTLVNSLQTTLGTKMFSWLTFLGEEYFIGILAIVLSIILWNFNKRRPIIVLWLTLACSSAFTYATKLIIDRPRPEYATILEHSGSFPSGHATLAVAFYGFLIYLFWKYSKNRRGRLLITVLGIVLILIIGFSRLYLGVHYLSDVITGYLIGLIWLYLSIKIVGTDHLILKD